MPWLQARNLARQYTVMLTMLLFLKEHCTALLFCSTRSLFKGAGSGACETIQYKVHCLNLFSVAFTAQLRS